tara:strand:+ start:15 stop:1361 length:1347 start_codon:yes stop_codon:yes gene_type:complete
MLTHTRSLALLTFLLLTVTALSAMAEETIDLYRTQILVKSQNEEDRNAAISNSLANIVVRISGRRDSLKQPLIKRALQRSGPYLSSFSYGKSDQILAQGEVEIVATELTLKFSVSAVDALLRRAELPFWPASRPSVLLWLVQDDRIDGRLYSTDGDYLQVIKRAAAGRGLPLKQPLLDLEDQMRVSVDDLWNFNSDSIQAASKRYGADIVVVGRFSEISRGGQSRWFANWQILRADGDSLLETEGKTAAAALLEGVERVADDLAARYAIVMADSLDSALTLQLSGVGDFAAYAEAIDYLEALPMVTSARPTYVSGQQLWLSLTTEGDLELFLNTLQQGQKLLPPATTSLNSDLNNTRYTPAGSVDNPLQYFWQARLKGSINAADSVVDGIEKNAEESVVDGAEKNAEESVVDGAEKNAEASAVDRGAVTTLQSLDAEQDLLPALVPND